MAPPRINRFTEQRGLKTGLNADFTEQRGLKTGLIAVFTDRRGLKPGLIAVFTNRRGLKTGLTANKDLLKLTIDNELSQPNVLGSLFPRTHSIHLYTKPLATAI